MKLTPSLVAWLSLLLALLAWAGVAFFAFSIGNMAQNTATAQTSVTTQSDQTSAALQTETLARDIAPESSSLESVLQIDPLALASIITQAGSDAGVALSVSNASPESPVSNASSQLSAIDFTVEAQGSFAKLAHAVLLLETLPVPSSVQEFDISELPPSAGGKASWELNAQIRVLTNSSLSS